MSRYSIAIAASLLLTACGDPNNSSGPAPSPAATDVAASLKVEAEVRDLPAEALPGGMTTFMQMSPLSAQSIHAFSHPSANLDSAGRRLFVVGNSFFTQPWVTAVASTAGRDGLGPLFNAAACQDCHIRDGRGVPPAGPSLPLTSGVIRIAQADGAPVPVYGKHIQTRSVPGLRPEARVSVAWQYRQERLADGSEIELREPEVTLSDWGYGPAPDGMRWGLRIAPAMIGMGLLEAIPESHVAAYAEQQKALGLRGIAQQLRTDAGAQEVLGRFGWKATQPSVHSQSLDAFVNDIGITSGLFPKDACTDRQREQGCAALPNGGEPELLPSIEKALVFYARHLAPPVRRGYEQPAVRAGKALFARLGCAGCHKPSWTTAATAISPAFAGQTIWPYTDLLLHDMGPGLADGIVEGKATGQHWRTAPLWGLSQVKAVAGDAAGYLHDGRARTLAEAILWHGGEAQSARDAWAALPRKQRQQLLAFLSSL